MSVLNQSVLFSRKVSRGTSTHHGEVANLFTLEVRVVLEVAAVLEPVDGDGEVAAHHHARQLRPATLLQALAEGEGVYFGRF